MNSIIKKPSAWIPIVLSLLVLLTILITFATAGSPTPQPDEGTGAHLFQIWLFIEVIMILVFAIKWLPKSPKQTFWILLIQIIAVIAACYPVYYFHL